MALTHWKIVNRERAKYGEDWLTLTEVSYGGYIFDLVAINLKTKEIEFTEVDFSAPTSKEKIEFAEKLGKVKIYRPLAEKVPKKDFQPTIDALSDPLRVAILELLLDSGSLTYSQIMNILHFPIRDGGRFAYHLKLLKKNSLILKNDIGKYEVSEKGRRIIQFFKELENKI